MKVAIYSRGLNDDQESHLLTLIEELTQHGVEICFYESLLGAHSAVNMLPGEFSVFSSHKELHDNIACLISLGGDGTMLDAATLVREKNIPIMGVNFGRLGFLASIGQDELSDAVDNLANRRYKTEKRTLLHLDAGTPLFGETPFALNEFAITKREFSPMINIQAYLNGEFLNNYWADGLIVSTPTGSSAYNMSCNGPIVFPDNSCFIITPIAPHSLNARSIIIADHNVVSFEVEGRADEFICMMDSRREIVDSNVRLAVKKETFEINLLTLPENSFLSTLRKKLTWGYDPRNK